MKKIHIKESKLNEIYSDNEFCAGTDHPYFENEETGEAYSADWNSDYGFPFGFWPIDYNGTMGFAIGEPWTTHANACGKCAEQYFNDSMSEQIDDEAYQLSEAIESFVSDFQEYGYQYDEENGLWVSADGSDERDMDDFIEEIRGQVSGPVDIYEYVSEFVENVTQGNTNVPSSSEIYEYLNNNLAEGYDFSDRDGIDRAMQQIGTDFYDYFELGNSEGRVWPEKGMIGFYETEQPDPDTLENILRNLQEKSELNMQDMLQYHMVFEDWRNDGTITACTVQDYIDGNYGLESYEDLDDEDDTPIQYNNGQKTIFVPHLANQQDKFNYYRDFRNTRDRAVYAPQERAAGNLAAYHAMRYPYGESKKKIGKIIREVIDNIIKMGG
jgi:hypothetical protein